VDLLTPDEEVTLAQRIRDGDQQALEKLTKLTSASWCRWPNSTRTRACRSVT
jgi:hypothetical protein